MAALKIELIKQVENGGTCAKEECSPMIIDQGIQDTAAPSKMSDTKKKQGLMTCLNKNGGHDDKQLTGENDGIEQDGVSLKGTLFNINKNKGNVINMENQEIDKSQKSQDGEKDDRKRDKKEENKEEVKDRKSAGNLLNTQKA